MSRRVLIAALVTLSLVLLAEAHPRLHVVGEQLLGVLIIALVSVLGTLAPAGDG
ncbi:MAG: hypothetical protein ACLQF2_11375 [Rhodomicrobium sp.]